MRNHLPDGDATVAILPQAACLPVRQAHGFVTVEEQAHCPGAHVSSQPVSTVGECAILIPDPDYRHLDSIPADPA
jgi:hypothetical protein